MSKDFPIICLMGPTASGKTQLAVELVQRFPMEIISVDSAMIYRGMDIGTAKPDEAILKIAPHQLIDICDPAESYSVGQFKVDVLAAIDAIIAKGKTPLLVGGTMMYFNVLQKGLSNLPVANDNVRLALQNEADQKGWPVLHERLTKIDPIVAQRVHPNDSQRIQRALEVYEVSGKALSVWQQENSGLAEDIKIVNIALIPSDRAVLHERIKLRFDNMLAQGFVDEVKKLYERGDLSLTNPSIRCVGYRQVWEYLLNHYNKEQMRERGIIATRQLAKRQLTWLRSWEEVNVFDSEDADILEKVGSFVSVVLFNKIEE